MIEEDWFLSLWITKRQCNLENDAEDMKRQKINQHIFKRKITKKKNKEKSKEPKD